MKTHQRTTARSEIHVGSRAPMEHPEDQPGMDERTSVEFPRHAWTGDDIYLFNEGTHYSLWDKLGAHLVEEGGKAGARFAVWAPNAAYVSVVGDFNGWNPDSHPLESLESSGIWQGFIPDLRQGACYK